MNVWLSVADKVTKPFKWHLTGVKKYHCCFQEETDTRIMLYYVYSSDQGSNCMIISPDPDILILLLHHRQNIATKEIFVHTWRVGLNTDLNPYMPIYKLYDILTKEAANNSVASVLFRCDTCNVFSNKGKNTHAKGK